MSKKSFHQVYHDFDYPDEPDYNNKGNYNNLNSNNNHGNSQNSYENYDQKYNIYDDPAKVDPDNQVGLLSEARGFSTMC